MKVLFVAIADDYGDPERGPSFEYETFLPALSRAAEAVVPFALDREVRDHGHFGAGRRLLELAAREKPDLAFFVLFENQLDRETVATLTQSGIPTVNWFCDDHWRFEAFSRFWAPNFSSVVTTDAGSYGRYRAIAGVRPILAQWAYDDLRFRPSGDEARYDVSFVGQARPHRLRMVKALQAAGISVHCRGTGWPQGRADTEELAAIPARSRVSLNFSDGGNSVRGGQRTQLKARVFELAGTGTCVVTEDDPQLRYYFRPGQEVVVFRGEDQLVESVAGLLADEPRRSAIAEAGLRRAHADHTYVRRLGDIFELVLGSPE